ncbi:Platelet-activating factor acetylhydrolase, isoform II [Sinosporangium album]|uniref:Platelet-activating factor acetylhydrolase, isoform II n=1 Tax=Sinosporangium album TaxID=504805 RepID=A0A1G8FP16_9ACTN|nr:alpha/beta hydrolase [Sinosporangium album]SDH83829.1 Platelet-activating factor acetylhydrolase, isoform II [Sinosporangium album]
MFRTSRNATVGLLALTLVLPASAATAASMSTPASAASSASTSDVRFAIPRPTGQYEVGRDTLHLVDGKRRDLWMPAAGPRELMVSMYYPARAGGKAAPYMGVEEALLLLKAQKLDTVFKAEQLAGVRVNARVGARPAGGKHPLVVLSPGFTLNRATLTTLAEELASKGYVVALVDHAYESFGTAFAGGRTLTCVACETVEKAPSDEEEKKLLGKAAANRAADISFVIDQLTHSPKTAPAWKRWKMIDQRRIGAAGHSLGGNAAASVMATDRRVRAGVNMDGTFFAPVPTSGLGKRPFLMLGTKAQHSPGSADATWLRDWRRLDGWKRWLTVADSGHFTFIDLPILGEQAGIKDPTAPLSGKRSGEITTGYVGAFFDQHLRGEHRPLLDGPSPDNPEVAFQNP